MQAQRGMPAARGSFTERLAYGLLRAAASKEGMLSLLRDFVNHSQGRSTRMTRPGEELILTKEQWREGHYVLKEDRCWYKVN